MSRRADARRIARVLAPGAVLALWALASFGFVAVTLEGAQRTQWLGAIEPRAAPLLLLWLVVSGALGAWVHRVDARRRAAAHEAVHQRSHDETARAQEVRAAVLAASGEIEQERSRLAALMSELTQSVVVCNLDGQVLLYNQRARFLFRGLSDAPSLAGGAELIGVGRSIHTVFDRQVIEHALDTIGQRLRRGVAQASAQFVTGTPGGQLLRAQMAPVRRAGGDAEALSGYVLMLDNITRELADAAQRDRWLLTLAEGSRASLGNLQAALEMLEYPDLDEPTRTRFLAVVRDESRRMAARLNEFSSSHAQLQKTRWPLEEMLGADLLAAAARRIESLLDCRVAVTDVDPGLWLQVDSYSLLQALAHLAGRLVSEHSLQRLQLRLSTAGARAQLDLWWIGQAMSTETVVAWETEPMVVAGEHSALTVRDVVDRHGAEFWFERERARQAAFFRFLLPVAAAQAEAAPLAPGDERPETYDFDLFGHSAPAREWAERRLAELSYTVFDTETTGLDPAGGDEIIQIGAARVVNGKLRRTESFEQLIDPGRSIPAASSAIHGITQEMVRGRPSIASVLPAFHAYARDTVLVGHNAAFDMRFLQLKEAATGVRFDQPVLDTLLLSAVVHPDHDAHGLEAIAERLDVPLTGRHTAMGDALVTAQVFLKLIALLAERDIHTLGQAREAAQQTYYARLTY